MRKNIIIKIKEPTTPKILERFVKINVPIKPPDETEGNNHLNSKIHIMQKMKIIRRLLR
jgi:hypothetical protein